nr:MAG TPA_asm: putative alpha/beta hydrolase domain protein [Caudoviricetes sp.]
MINDCLKRIVIFLDGNANSFIAQLVMVGIF